MTPLIRELATKLKDLPHTYTEEAKAGVCDVCECSESDVRHEESKREIAAAVSLPREKGI